MITPQEQSPSQGSSPREAVDPRNRVFVFLVIAGELVELAEHLAFVELGIPGEPGVQIPGSAHGAAAEGRFRIEPFHVQRVPAPQPYPCVRTMAARGS